jgi:hypothetical protein
LLFECGKETKKHDREREKEGTSHLHGKQPIHDRQGGTSLFHLFTDREISMSLSSDGYAPGYREGMVERASFQTA